MSSPAENPELPPLPEPPPVPENPLTPPSPGETFLKAIGLLDQLQPIYTLNMEHHSSSPHFDELFKNIEADPTLLKSFLKFANKGWFNSRIKIETPYMAFTRYGTEGFYKITLATFLANGIGELGTRFKIWPHLEKCARLCEHMAEQLAPQFAEDAFVVGLLHDALVAPMDRHLPDYLYFLECAVNLDPHVALFENETHKFDHAALAADVSLALGFEASLVEAIRHHHSDKPTALSTQKARALLALLHLVKRSQILSRLHIKVKFNTDSGQKFVQEIASSLNISAARALGAIEELVADLKLRDDNAE